MAGVRGWWDEDPGERMDELSGMSAQGVDESGDKSPFHDVDEKVLASLKEGGAEQHLAELEDVEADVITQEDIQGIKDKINATPVAQLLPTTAPAWISVSGGSITNATTMSLDYVNLTGQDYRRFQEYKKAFEKVSAALDQLTPKVMGLPTKEYKSVKKELELVARVMVEAQEKGLR